MTTDLEAELRSLLSGKADSLDAHPRSYDPYPGTALRVRRDRRRRRLLATVATVVAIAAVAVPASTGVLRAGRSAPETLVADWPTRGSLATDIVFVTALRGQAGGGRVLYAGDDGVHRVGLVYLATKSMATTTVFYGQTGEPATKLPKIEVSSTPPGHDLGPTSPFVWVSQPEQSVETPRALLVVGDPRMRNLRLSPTVIVGPGASMHRVGHPIASSGGTTLTEVSGMRKPRLKATLGHRTFDLPTGVSNEAVSNGDNLSDHSMTTRHAVSREGDDVSDLLSQAANGLGVAEPTIRLTTRWRGVINGYSTLVACLNVPGFPVFQVVQFTRRQPDGSSVSRIFVGPDTASVGWPVIDPAATGKVHADGAVLAPGEPNRRVVLTLGARALAEADTDAKGLATFELTGLTDVQLAKARYQVFDDNGQVMTSGTMNAAGYGDGFDVMKW